MSLDEFKCDLAVKCHQHYTPGRGKIVPRNYTPGRGKIVPRNVI